MSKTSLSVAEARAQLPADGKRLLKLWEGLGNGDFTRSELDQRIIALSGIYKGDLARAQAIRSSLEVAKVVLIHLDENGADVYRRAKEFPIHPSNRHGTDSFNEKLTKMAAEQRRLVDKEAEASRTRWEESPQYRERIEVEELVKRQVAELHAAEREDLKAEVVKEVLEALEEHLDAPAKKRLFDFLRERNQKAFAA